LTAIEDEGRGAGAFTQQTSDFLCRLAHYVELVFVWLLIEMAMLVEFYWLTQALFRSPKKYAMIFCQTHSLKKISSLTDTALRNLFNFFIKSTL